MASVNISGLLTGQRSSNRLMVNLVNYECRAAFIKSKPIHTKEVFFRITSIPIIVCYEMDSKSSMVVTFHAKSVHYWMILDT